MPTCEAIAKVPAARAFLDPGEIERALALGFRLLEAAKVYARSLAELGEIDLPPISGSNVVQANLRAIAPLYLASELEEACLLPAVEILARLFASGAIATDTGPATASLMVFWKERREQFSAAERTSLFAHLFGSGDAAAPAEGPGTNNAFEPLMVQFTEALSALTSINGAREQTRLRVVASQLAENLGQRSGGITAFAGDEILKVMQKAIELLKQPTIQQAVGAHSVWMAVQSLAERYLEKSPDISTHVTRGKSGQIVLAWLAEIAPQLDIVSTPIIQTGNPAIEAAVAWLQVTNAAS